MRQRLLLVILASVVVLALYHYFHHLQPVPYDETRNSPEIPTREFSAPLQQDVTSKTLESPLETQTKLLSKQQESQNLESPPPPLDIVSINTHVNALINRRKHADALNMVEQGLLMDLEQNVREQLLVQQGNLLMAMGSKQDALDIFWSLIVSGEEKKAIEAALPKFYVLAKDLGQFSPKLAELESRHSDYPDDLRTMITLADLYAYAQEKDKECAMRKLIADCSNETQNLVHLMSVYISQKNYPAAAETAGRLAQIDTNHTGNHLARQAYIELKGGDIATARQTCGKALSEPSADAQVLLRIGKLYLQMQDYEGALNAFEAGKKIAEHRFRKQRCQLEACRMKAKLHRLNNDDIAFIEEMSAEGIADGVKRDATSMLPNIYKENPK